jgi:hypothetical protein
MLILLLLNGVYMIGGGTNMTGAIRQRFSDGRAMIGARMSGVI